MSVFSIFFPSPADSVHEGDEKPEGGHRSEKAKVAEFPSTWMVEIFRRLRQGGRERRVLVVNTHTRQLNEIDDKKGAVQPFPRMLLF